MIHPLTFPFCVFAYMVLGGIYPVCGNRPTSCRYRLPQISACQRPGWKAWWETTTCRALRRWWRVTNESWSTDGAGVNSRTRSLVIFYCLAYHSVHHPWGSWSCRTGAYTTLWASVSFANDVRLVGDPDALWILWPRRPIKNQERRQGG